MMLQGKAVGGALLLMFLCGCAPTGKEARTLADATVAPSHPAAPPAAPVTTPVPSDAAPGVKVFIDPATGLQRAPTAQEWASMVQQQEKKRLESGTPPPSPASEMILSDGTRGYVLGDAAKTSLRACKRADGATSVGHECPPTTSDATNGKVP